MSHEQIVRETGVYQIEEFKSALQQARQEVSFFQMEQRALALRSASLLHSTLPVTLPLVLTNIITHSGESLQNTPLFQTHPSGICLQGHAELFLPGQLALYCQSAAEQFVLLQVPLVDEYQILQAKVAGIQALAFSPQLLGARRAQLYYEKIRLLGLLPVVEINSLQELSKALILSPDFLLVHTPFQSPAAHELVTLIRQQLKKTTQIIFQGNVDSPDEWLHLQEMGVDCFCLSAQNLEHLAQKDVFTQMFPTPSELADRIGTSSEFRL